MGDDRQSLVPHNHHMFNASHIGADMTKSFFVGRSSLIRWAFVIPDLHRAYVMDDFGDLTPIDHQLNYSLHGSMQAI